MYSRGSRLSPTGWRVSGFLSTRVAYLLGTNKAYASGTRRSTVVLSTISSFSLPHLPPTAAPAHAYRVGERLTLGETGLSASSFSSEPDCRSTLRPPAEAVRCSSFLSSRSALSPENAPTPCWMSKPTLRLCYVTATFCPPKCLQSRST